MSWAKERKTKREEDVVYSLLGIFGIHMSLIYGEGREEALIRLQEVMKGRKDRVKPIPDAILNGIWRVSSGSISFTNRDGFLAVNGKVLRNIQGQACPWDQCVHTSMGPRSAGFLPNFMGRLPVIGLYGAGVITIGWL